MPSDLEIVWNEQVVFVQPASMRGMEWLQKVMPQKYEWGMRVLPHEAMADFSMAARDQGIDIGGVRMPFVGDLS